MIINLELKTKFDTIPSDIIELSDNGDFSDDLTSVVYSDSIYTFVVKNYSDNQFKNIKLSINDNEIRINTIINSNNEIEIDVSNNKPFDMIYGFADIVLEIDNNIFFSKPIAVAIKNSKDYEQSVNNIICEILSNNRNLLTLKSVNEINPKKLSTHKIMQYEQELNLINDIIKKYEKNFSSFSVNPYTGTTNSYVIEKLEKLSYIDHKTLQYIAENPQELRFNNKPTGIRFNNLPVVPEKTLVRNTVKSKDIYENQQILGFLLYLSNYIKNRSKEIDYKIKSKIIKYKTVDKKFEREGYKLSNVIIKLYSEQLYSDFYKKLNLYDKKVTTLINKYSKIFNIKTIPISMIPRPTPVFLEISHYNILFLMMKKWFSNNTLNIQSLENILNFPSADKLYELYTLVNLYDCICKNDYVEVKRENYNYLEGLPDPYKVKTKIDNTYVFEKQNTKLFLYYQPVIFANITGKTNNIKLCRADSQRSYFVPDFLIKKVTNKNEEQYIILDSKWRSMNTLKEFDNGLKDTIYKYYCSILNINNGQHVSKIWLISGKNSNEGIYYHLRNTTNDIISANMDKFGIVNLAPEISKDYFNYVINKIIL